MTTFALVCGNGSHHVHSQQNRTCSSDIRPRVRMHPRRRAARTTLAATPKALPSYNIRTFPSCDPETSAPDRSSSLTITSSRHHTPRPRYAIARTVRRQSDPWMAAAHDPTLRDGSPSSDTGRFRMWYNDRAGTESAIAYAESADGKTWETPNLGIWAIRTVSWYQRALSEWIRRQRDR